MTRDRAIEPRSVRVGMGVVSVLVLLFLYVPLVVIMLYAFNPARSQSWPLPGLSTRWFVATWNNADVRTALITSLKAGLGATTIALSSGDATRLGIDYRKGRPGMMGTANGVATAYALKLDTVRVGDIVLNNVDAAVLEGNPMPFALLGMSFLNRMEMKREGQTMVLIRRF